MVVSKAVCSSRSPPAAFLLSSAHVQTHTLVGADQLSIKINSAGEELLLAASDRRRRRVGDQELVVEKFLISATNRNCVLGGEKNRT